MLGHLIGLIHYLLIVFIIGTPFMGSEYFMTLHIVIIPFIMLHWITNQSVCALTEMEKLLKGETDDDKTFFGQVVGPVYKFRTQGDENTFLWTLLIGLWLISVYKLHSTDYSYLRAEYERFKTLFTPHPQTPPPE
jgi:hypothetical protein